MKTVMTRVLQMTSILKMALSRKPDPKDKSTPQCSGAIPWVSFQAMYLAREKFLSCRWLGDPDSLRKKCQNALTTIDRACTMPYLRIGIIYLKLRFWHKLHQIAKIIFSFVKNPIKLFEIEQRKLQVPRAKLNSFEAPVNHKDF